MQEMKIFENKEFGKVRTVVIDNEPWFVGKDVATALGYERTADAIRQHIEADDKGVSKIQTPGGVQNMAIINESGLYALIFGSKLKSAKRFKHWVMNEILSSERKNHIMAPVTQNTSVQIFSNEELGANVRTILNDDGSISVNAEDTAIGFGWYQTQNKNGKDYISIRWERMNSFSEECGFPHKWGGKMITSQNRFSIDLV